MRQLTIELDFGRFATFSAARVMDQRHSTKEQQDTEACLQAKHGEMPHAILELVPEEERFSSRQRG